MKCGHKTSEFWLAAGSTLAALITIVAAMAFKWTLDASLLGAGLSPTIVYITGRSAVKFGTKNEEEK